MLEELKQKVYEANMELPKRKLSPTLGAMSAASTAKRACSLSSPPASITMT